MLVSECYGWTEHHQELKSAVPLRTQDCNNPAQNPHGHLFVSTDRFCLWLHSLFWHASCFLPVCGCSCVFSSHYVGVRLSPSSKSQINMCDWLFVLRDFVDPRDLALLTKTHREQAFFNTCTFFPFTFLIAPVETEDLAGYSYCALHVKDHNSCMAGFSDILQVCRCLHLVKLFI